MQQVEKPEPPVEYWKHALDAVSEQRNNALNEAASLRAQLLIVSAELAAFKNAGNTGGGAP